MMRILSNIFSFWNLLRFIFGKHLQFPQVFEKVYSVFGVQTGIYQLDPLH